MVILSEGIALLDVNPGLAIWTAITFLFVLLILWKFAWRPILNALDARNAKVEDDLNKSKELREKAESLLAEYEAKLNSAKTEALQIIDEGKKDAEENNQRILKEATDEATRIKDRAQAEIEQAKLKALQEIEARVVDLTVNVVSQVMRKNISDAEHREMISKELASIK